MFRYQKCQQTESHSLSMSNMTAMVRFGSHDETLTIPFDTSEEVNMLIKRIADEQGIEAECLLIGIFGKQYNHTHSQTLASLGAFDRMDVTVTTRMHDGML